MQSPFGTLSIRFWVRRYILSKPKPQDVLLDIRSCGQDHSFTITSKFHQHQTDINSWAQTLQECKRLFYNSSQAMYQDSLLFPNTSSHLFLPKVTSRVHGGKHLEAVCCFDHLHLIISALSTSLLRQQYWSLWLQYRVQSLQHWVVSEGDFIDEKHGAFFHGGDQRPINPLKQPVALRVLLHEGKKWFMTRMEQLVALRVLLHEGKMIHDKDGTACGFESSCVKGKWFMTTRMEQLVALRVLLCEWEMIYHNQPFRQRSGWFILWCYLQETGLFSSFLK